MHSNGFFNSERVMEDPMLLDHAAQDLVALLQSELFPLAPLNRVVGPAMGAITLAHDLARNISITRGGKPCLRGYAEKATVGNERRMEFGRAGPRTSELVLPCEDVLTTGGSVESMLDAVASAGALAVPFVLVLVNRSGLTSIAGHRIIALIERHLPIWKPNECPLCKEGSVALRPKGEENWKQLLQEYPQEVHQ
jgi:orotate phosphoribosyltransferase